ncbi:hypothetical protein KAR34_10050 [bacterium]|nr:hypothetical protein [bacterium]
MIPNGLLYIGAVFILLWGIAHLFPTKNVVRGFGEISQDNKHIITMEWIVEGVALAYIGITVIVITILGGTGNPIGIAYYRMAAAGLAVLAVVSGFTGAKVNFLPFKLCVPIMSTSAVLFFLGSILK